MGIVLNGLEWNAIGGRLTLDEAKKAAAEAGGRLPTLEELHSAYGFIDSDVIDDGKLREWHKVLATLNVTRTWAANECDGTWTVDPEDAGYQFNGQPRGFQFIASHGTTWPHPAGDRLTSFVVREA